jgi:outer membrane protein assembly factor BamB
MHSSVGVSPLTKVLSNTVLFTLLVIISLLLPVVTMPFASQEVKPSNAASNSSVTSWMTYLGNEFRTGSTPDQAPLNSNQAWNLTSDLQLSSFSYSSAPVVVNGIEYLPLSDQSGLREGDLLAINVTTGDIIWSHLTQDYFPLTPSYGSGVLFVGYESDGIGGFSIGHVTALDANTGQRIWDYAIPINHQFSRNSNIFSTPLVYGGKIIGTAMANEIFALNESTGSQLWLQNGSEQQEILAYSSPSLLDNRGYVFAGNAEVNAVNGSFVGVVNITKAGITNYAQTATIYQNSLLIIPSTDGTVFAFDANTLKQLWNFTIPGARSISDISVDSGVIYVGSTSGLYALSVDNGAVVWRIPNLSTGSGYCAVSSYHNLVYVKVSNSGIEAINGTNGNMVWNYFTRGGENKFFSFSGNLERVFAFRRFCFP